MPNGRCHLHGGKSTSPRTAVGYDQCRLARWKHGKYSEGVVAPQRRVRELLHEANGLLEDLRKPTRLPSAGKTCGSPSSRTSWHTNSQMERVLSAIEEGLHVRITFMAKTGEIMDAGMDHAMRLASLGLFLKLLEHGRAAGYTPRLRLCVQEIIGRVISVI